MEKQGGSDEVADRAAFEKYLSALRGQVGDAKFKSWFLDLGLSERTTERVTLSTPSESKRDIIDHRYLPILTEIWRREIGPVDRVSLTVRSAALSVNAAKVDERVNNRPSTDFSITKSSSSGASLRDQLAAPLDEKRSYDTLAIGGANRLAVAAIRQTLSDSAPCELVYLYGDSGVGKTHLLHAACHAGEARFGPNRCLYVTYRNLINVCVNAVLSKKTQALHEAFLDNDLIAIDDIHFLEGKDRTQEELLMVIDALLDSGKSIAIAGDLPPSRLGDVGIKKRLADRLAGGLCAPVNAADEEMRFTVLKKRIEQSAARCVIGDDVLSFIAKNFHQSTRETIGALKQVLLMFADEPVEVSLDDAKTVLKSRLEDEGRRKVATLDDAIVAGAEAFGLTSGEIVGRAQPQRIARARHAIVYCAREVLGESFPRVGKALKRDHTTVMSSYRRAQALIERDKAFQAGVARIREALEG